MQSVAPLKTFGQGRRRNETAHRAILTATVRLLDDPAVGLDGLTIEAVARRASVSKATIYRWWRGKAELVVDAYAAKAARDVPVPDTGSVRQDLVELLGRLAYALTNLGSGRTMTDLVIGAQEDVRFGELFRRTLLATRRRAVADVLDRGRMRGEVRQDAVLSVVVDMLYGAMYHRLLMSREPIDGSFVTTLVDSILCGVAAPASTA